MPGAVEARLNAKLVRRRTEDRLEAADKMERRHGGFSSDFGDRKRKVVDFAKHVSGAAKMSESAARQHGQSLPPVARASKPDKIPMLKWRLP